MFKLNDNAGYYDLNSCHFGTPLCCRLIAVFSNLLILF